MKLRTCYACYGIVAPTKGACPICDYRFPSPAPRLPWVVLSRNSREISHEGRHFLAMRCGLSPASGWTIRELRVPGGQWVRVVASGVATSELSRAIM